MQLKRWNDILAIKTESGRFVGYHARNLEVAEISEEIWNGLESSMDSDAEEQLLAWSQEQKEFPAPAMSHKINTITLNVTQICNLHCTYCAAGGDGTYGDAMTRISVEKTLPQLKFLLAQLKSGETFQITYLGGEPLLYPEGIQLLGQFLNGEGSRLGIQIRHRIVTNGTLLSSQNIRILTDLKAHVVVSIDGPAKVNDRNRPMKGQQSATAVVVEGLERIKQVKPQLGSFRLSGVFGKNNLLLLEAYEFYRQFDADNYDFNFDHDETEPQLALDFSRAFEQVVARAFEIGGEKELRKIVTMDRIFTNLDRQSRVLNYCGAGKNFVMIDSKNNIFPCVWSPNKASEAVGSGSYLSSSKLAQFQKPLMEKQGCNTCWARYLCGGGCSYVHEKASGSKSVPAEVFCFQSRYLISLAISYYQQCRN
jgi:uncharacterized protein